MKLVLLCILAYAGGVQTTPASQNMSCPRYDATWEALARRPLPRWYDGAKIGIFIHWGLYSVPAFVSEWFWKMWMEGNPVINKFVAENYRPGFKYQDFPPMFTAKYFDPIDWATLFKRAGAKYVVLTTKHHDGYALFPSKQSFNWNSVDNGPRCDIVKELAQTVREQGLDFGVYYSLLEWFHPFYLDDKNLGTTWYPEQKVWPDIKQLIEDYQPSVLWFDGDWSNFDVYWNSTNVLAWLYNDSPVKDRIVVNDRLGLPEGCSHGDFFSYEYYLGNTDRKSCKQRKWEHALSLDKVAWGYRKDAALSHILTIENLIYHIVSIVSSGGNVLVNIGPTAEGLIPLIFQKRLTQMGQWLQVNGEAIYDSSSWLHQNDSLNDNVWYTCTKQTYNALQLIAKPLDNEVTKIFLIFLKWPLDSVLKVKDIGSELQNGTFQAVMLDKYKHQSVTWAISEGITAIKLPSKATVKSDYAWTIKFTKKEL